VVLDDDVFPGTPQGDALAEPLAHQRVVRREAERHAVRAIFVLGPGMGTVVHVHEPGSARARSQYAVRSERDPVDREQRRRVVGARGLFTGLERRTLDLEAHDAAEVAHNGI